jgi:hypothetical protein
MNCITPPPNGIQSSTICLANVWEVEQYLGRAPGRASHKYSDDQTRADGRSLQDLI